MGKTNIINLNERVIVDLIDKILYTIWFKSWFRLLDYSLSLIFLTTYEKERKKVQVKDNLALFILSITLTIILTPIGLTFFLLWVIIIRVIFRKKPYKLSIAIKNNDKIEYYDEKKNFEILSANVCLLPEFLSRLNNLHQTEKRLHTVGSLLTTASKDKLNEQSHDYDLNNNDKNEEKTKKFIEIIDNYADHSHNIDFICIQEVWTVKNSNKLKDLLHDKYPYIVYDVGVNAFSSNCLIGLDSGLMFCSKYPILNVEFKTFNSKMKTCRFSSKGLLIAKVLLGKNKSGKNITGFISNTHLQSYQEKTKIHSLQMDDMLYWLKEFRKKHTDEDGEIVAFDIVCGDFNMDNYSPVDQPDLDHELLKQYADPVCSESGLDHVDSIGTEMRQFSLYDESVATPEKLKDVLLNERLRRWFVFDANIKHASLDMLKERPELCDNDGLPVLLPEISGKRRVDRILFNKEYALNVEKYKFITNMTRLTDHIPISMEFRCPIA